jgi:hypothetical protein
MSTKNTRQAGRVGAPRQEARACRDRKKVHRRAFLHSAAAGLGAGASALVLPWSVFGAAAPQRKLNVAAIGAGGRSGALLSEVLRLGENLVALCDVDQRQIARTQASLAGAGEHGARAMEKVRIYGDYRTLLEQDRSFDAVLVATGCRWHAPLAVAVMRAGKHVYCEKPLVRKLAEARELAGLARRSPLATQTGTQGGSSKAFRRAVEVIQAGVLGEVREVYLWCDYYGKFPPSQDRPAGEDPIPAGLNWDFWLGPAAYRPFKRQIYHPGCLAFQNWLDLDNGMLAGQGAHQFYLPARALGLGPPCRVEAEIAEPLRETYPSQTCFRFEFPARGARAPVKLWWSDGGRYPPEHVTRRVQTISGKVPNIGCLFLGEKGDLLAGGWGEGGVMRMAGETRWRGVLDHDAARPVPVTLPRAEGDNHMLEWLSACKGGPATFTGFEIGSGVSEVYLPGILALRLGRPITWDAAGLRVPGEPQADPLIQKCYRRKWLL